MRINRNSRCVRWVSRSGIVALALLPGLLGAGVGRAQTPANHKFTEDKPAGEVTNATPSQRTSGAWWVYLNDGDGVFEPLADAATRVRDRAVDRRQRRGSGSVTTGQVMMQDRAPSTTTLARIRETGATIRIVSRWLGAVSVNMPADEARQTTVLQALRALPGVRRVEPVACHASAIRRESDDRPNFIYTYPSIRGSERFAKDDRSVAELDTAAYGFAWEQLDAHTIPAVHDQGYTGAGVRVAVFDAGFQMVDEHVALQHVPIIDRYDFVDDDSDIPGHPHGTQVLSVFAARDSGAYIGAAPDVELLLARTEDVSSETPAEEDYFIAALEWAETNGADLVVASLSYDDWYEPSDFDGDTAPITVACDHAAALGMLVVTSVGNTGDAGMTVPADGDSVLAVGALDELGAYAPFSTQGPTADGRIKPDLAVRGVDVWQVNAGTDNAYRTGSGTSYACPLAGGVAALLLEAVPTLNPAELIDVLRNTAGQAGAPDNQVGWGSVDALAALNAALTEVARPATAERGGLPTQVTLRAWPNPVNGSLTVQLGGLQPGSYELRVVSVLGRTVAVRRVEAGRSPVRMGWDLTGVASGRYWLQVVDSGTGAGKAVPVTVVR